jgi:hypothetical protein
MDWCDDICEMKHTLTDLMKAELAEGAENVDTMEAGQVIDMIKDLAEAEEKHTKACYYKTLIHAMTEKDAEHHYSDNDVTNHMDWIKDYGMHADPEVRKKLKADLTKLIGEIPA